MRRAARRGSGPEKAARTLMEIDYLLGVHDVSRLGALRFAEKDGGPFLAAGSRDTVPLLVSLSRLLQASDRVLDEEDTEEDLRLLLDPGSSLGGARPKASVLDTDGSLCMAKFPSRSDDWSVVLWEAVALTLAEKAGIPVPTWRIHKVAGRPVLILKRFDRLAAGEARIPFLSAMSMLGARDQETRCYLELADALRRWGAAPREDLRGLFRRVVFNILISNTDDHLRNHGYLAPDPRGWRMAPAYDLNPTPVDVKPRVLSTEIDFGQPVASLETAIGVAGYFGVSVAEARTLAGEVGRVVAGWQAEARRMGIPAAEMNRLSSAFEHGDLAAARRL